MVRLYNKNNISVLVEKVKNLHLDQVSNFYKLDELLELIFLELKKVRAKFLNKLDISSHIAYAYEVEEDMVIGLIGLLHEKLVDFAKSCKQ